MAPKKYKVCIDCIIDLQNYMPSTKHSCKNKPRCFDQPERIKSDEKKVEKEEDNDSKTELV